MNLYWATAVVATVLCLQLGICQAQTLLEGIYCGEQNCYDVLSVTRQSTRSEIAKSYRQLARKYHPDLQRGDAEAKAESEENFKRVANAYEILKDEESRNDYDYMLDNPDEYYAHYYRYYRRRVSPKVDVRIVIVVALTIISAIQYYSGWQRYEDAINYFQTVPKYRNRALAIIKEREAANGTSESNGLSKRAARAAKPSKAELKEKSEHEIRKVIIENMDIKGAYAKPVWTDILWWQLIISPYTLVKYCVWNISWVWKFNVMKQEYGEEEKLYLIRKLLGMGKHQFGLVEEDQQQEYLRLELWRKDKFVEWKQEEEEEQAKAMADNPRHKQYRRYMKNHGNSRMTFED